MDEREMMFKEKIEILKASISDPDIHPEDLDLFPEDFYRLTKRQLMYLWHYLSDKKIGELYDISPRNVKKRRQAFEIDPITSMFDRRDRKL